MATSKKSRGELPSSAEPESLSAFIARVLNQLSISAWLPGAFLIASLAMLTWFHFNGITLAGVGTYVEKHWIPLLVLALPSLVLATLLTQAFAFEAIRSLEGYWRRRGPASWWRSACIRFQLWRKRSLQKRERKTSIKLFKSAEPRLLEEGVDALVMLAVAADSQAKPRPQGIPEEKHLEADELRWWDKCDPWGMAKLTRLQRDRAQFPEDSRVMPTKLGNILRSTEDNLRHHGGDLEGFVMTHREDVPSRALVHHDQFRTRLDMYCILFFVGLALAISSVVLLWDQSDARIVGPVVFLIVSLASYGAALSSARGYATALRQFDKAVGQASAGL